MLKPYHDRQDQDGGKPKALVVSVEHESVEKPHSDDDDKKVIRLKTDTLNNLGQKLKHFPDPKKNMI